MSPKCKYCIYWIRCNSHIVENIGKCKLVYHNCIDWTHNSYYPNGLGGLGFILDLRGTHEIPEDACCSL